MFLKCPSFCLKGAIESGNSSLTTVYHGYIGGVTTIMADSQPTDKMTLTGTTTVMFGSTTLIK